MLDLLCLYQGLEGREICSMLCHISGKDTTYHPLSEDSEFIWSKLLKEARVLLLHQRECLSHMEVLLDRYIVIPDGSRCYGIRVICVSKPIMTKIVTDSCDQETHGIDMIQFCQIGESSLSQEEMCHVCYIEAMEIIVILYLFSVSFLHIGKELREFLFIHILDELMFQEQVNR